MAGWRVEVTGLRETMDALKAADEVAYKGIVQTITGIANDVAQSSRSFLPIEVLNNWGSWGNLSVRRNRSSSTGFALESRDLSYRKGDASSGIKIKRNNFRRRGISAGYGVDVQQTDWAGAIFEIVGEGSRVTTSSGQALVNAINSKYGSFRPRALVRGYYSVDIESRADDVRDRIANELIRLGLTDGA